MAASATGAKLTAPPAVTAKDESLPSLFSRLGDDVMQLFDTKLSLLKVELKEEANEYARDGIMIGAGGIIAAIGFLAAGVLYMVIGVILITSMKNRLAKQSLVPDRTVKELRKDKQWLKNEL